VKLSSVIDELVEERGLDRELLFSIISESVLSAFQKKYPELILAAEYDKNNDDVAINVQKKVVATVKDDDFEISLRKARAFDSNVAVGDDIWVPFDSPIGRIDILRAKQTIAYRIRKIEADAIYNEFKDKEGSIVNGVVHKCERSGTVVKIRDYLAFLPKSLSIPNERCVIGYPIRAILKEVLPEPRNENQLILDRSSSDFIVKLFELEIPEVFEHLVEIKRIARIPGYKSKIVVESHDANIDPVGTCVGVGGVRIKPILKEVDSEKIDIISWSDSPETLVANSLKPAQVNRVDIISDNAADVWVDEDQRSLAIGKMGQNITLASQLVGMDIRLVSPEPKLNDELIESLKDVGEEDME